MPETYLALLRGINVGGKNKLPMADLRAICLAAGCRDVRTYIQSGNVIFAADPALIETLPASIERGIAAHSGLRVPIVLRGADQLDAAIAANPFLAQGAGEESLHALFLAHQPAPERVAALDPDRSPPDAFAVHGREIYLCLPNGMGRTKLTNDYFDRALATISTGRNWRTVTTLLAMMRGGGP